MLTCAFGVDWALHLPDPCLWCEAESQRLSELFDAAVVAGTYDTQGFTPNERRAQQKRKAERERPQ